jgi:ATP-binding cassette subfamily B protein
VRLFQERDVKALAIILPYLVRYRWQVVLAFACLIAITATTLIVPILMKEIVDGLSTPGATLVVPLGLLLGYGLVRFASVVFRELRGAVFGKVSVRAMRGLSLKLLTHLHSLDLEYHLGRRTGAIARDLDRGVDGIEALLRLIVFSILPDVLQVVGVTAVLLYSYDGYFAAITFASVGIYAIYTVYVTEWRTPIIRASNEANSRANNRAVDSLINYETVKQFNNERLEAELYDEDLKQWERWRRRNRYSLAALNTGQSFFTTCGITAMMVLAARHVVDGSMTVGDLVLINSYASTVFMQINNLGGTYREFKGALTDIERMFDILDLSPTVHDAPDAIALPAGNGPIEFDHVSFSYHEKRPILRDLSFVVRPGEKVAVVGPSGAGKSTIARLLFRFYDPKKGSVRVNGVDVKAVSLESLRSAIGIVPQDTTLFNATLHDNIAYGDPAAPIEAVHEAASLAHLDGLISRLPDGYDTLVGERGLKLSGGEKQRVAIARAIMKRPAFLVFDEATSSLDSNSELAILTALNEVAEGRTTLVIAHRLSTVADADRIIVLDDGRIVEEGTHASLIRRDGLYRQMWDLQATEGELPTIHPPKIGAVS